MGEANTKARSRARIQTLLQCFRMGLRVVRRAWVGALDLVFARVGGKLGRRTEILSPGETAQEANENLKI